MTRDQAPARQMTMALDIARSAVMGIAAQPKTALRLFLGPFLLSLAGFAGFRIEPLWALVTETSEPQLLLFYAGMVTISVMICAGLLWLGLVWHRYMLPTARALNGRIVFRYSLKALPLALLVASVGLLTTALGALGLGQSAVTSATAGGLCMYIALRFSPVLPMAATGQSLSYRMAWRATRPLWAGCVLLVLLYIVLTSATGILQTLILPSGNAAVPVAVLIFMVEMLIALAVITQLCKRVMPYPL